MKKSTAAGTQSASAAGKSRVQGMSDWRTKLRTAEAAQNKEPASDVEVRTPASMPAHPVVVAEKRRAATQEEVTAHDPLLRVAPEHTPAGMRLAIGHRANTSDLLVVASHGANEPTGKNMVIKIPHGFYAYLRQRTTGSMGTVLMALAARGLAELEKSEEVLLVGRDPTLPKLGREKRMATGQVRHLGRPVTPAAPSGETPPSTAGAEGAGAPSESSETVEA